MRSHRAAVAILLGSLVAGCTSNSSTVPSLTAAQSQAPATSVAASPTFSVAACTPGAVTRFLPPSPHDEDILTGLATPSGRDAWAVGEQFNGRSADPGGQLTLIEHWDGRSWSIVEGPNTGPGNSSLVSASAKTPHDVWAVGRFEATNKRATGPERPLVEHWDGRSWRIVPTPVPTDHEANSGVGLDGVEALAQNDVWAVGTNWILQGGASTPQTLTEHWDGHLWRVVPSPNLDDGSILTAVSGSSHNNVWAVGASYVGFGEISSARALVEHWDGKEWMIVPGPTTGGVEPFPGTIGTVATTGPNVVWVAWDNHVFRWDGSTWTAVPSLGRVLALASRGSNDVWAAGDALAHWSGTGWTKIPMKPNLRKGSTFNALAIAPNRDVWTAGGIGYAMGHQHPFAVRKCSG